MHIFSLTYLKTLEQSLAQFLDTQKYWLAGWLAGWTNVPESQLSGVLAMEASVSSSIKWNGRTNWKDGDIKVLVKSPVQC